MNEKKENESGKLKQLFHKHYELITYGIFGVLTTLVNFIINYSLLWIFGEKHYLLFIVISWVGAVIFAYITNKKYVFLDKDRTISHVIKQLLLFSAARLLSLGFETIISYIFVEWLHWDVNIVKIVASVGVVILNYIFSKLFVFVKPRKK